MELLSRSDDEIRSIAEPILKNIVVGTNTKNWDLFSTHMLVEEVSDPKAREDVEKQWEENEWLTHLCDTAEYLGVIRKSDAVVVLWKQKSLKTSEEFLEKLVLVEVNGEIKQSGIWLE